ncbi:hypothetical protein B0F90DRAFT_1808783 [Multifurca ochricompacta]|uniref:Zn(2)-C6 fungal-type domain-containing protein n=1 Tax=Multifurca ochricompacta TaxID=376703 RepID=A0AAD4M818_9AGAM|nr:hypothetical protein B0F90DRAFT_1808783 [Multifurca ochricompacta]
MSLSPTNSTIPSPVIPSKRRRAQVDQQHSQPLMDESPTAPSTTSGHIPKRGARACTACRKGKNRCEGEAPCRRCQLSGQPCIFEKPEKKNGQLLSTASVERLSRLEGQYVVMQSQMIGLQTSLDRILAAVTQPGAPGTIRDGPGYVTNVSGTRTGLDPQYDPALMQDQRPPTQRVFPPLPGFAPPPHKYATYGIVPSTAPSSEDESEETLPRSTINAPIEALQGLANAAAEAAAAPSFSASRVKKRKRTEPIPRNAFPHVVEKGLVSDVEAKELFNIFFSGCNLFIPIFDVSYDTYEGLMERSPWTFDAILAVSGKIKSGNNPPAPSFYKALEEAQGIARSSLFGPVVRKEAVQGMLLLAAWSTNGWLPSGHAMRMALDLGLHRALEKLADNNKKRTEEEERDLVVSSHLQVYVLISCPTRRMSLGTGRPIVLREESSIRHCRVLLSHPMSSRTDVRLISLVELIAQKTQIYETLTSMNGQVNHNTLAFIRRASEALDKWWRDCDELHRQSMDEDSLLVKILAGELHYAKLWLVCVALRGVSWDKMPFEQRELAFQAKDAASNCLAIFLGSQDYRAALRYAVHDSLVTAAFSGLFLLKMANLFPTELDLNQITGQVEQLAQLLSEVAAERYALTLRVMLANLRRKMGLVHGGGPGDTMVLGGQPQGQPFGDPHQPQQIIPAQQPPPLTMEELGLHFPQGAPAPPALHPADIPIWLQEQSLTDLGLPVNGSDGIFMNLSRGTGWPGEFAPMPEAW